MQIVGSSALKVFWERNPHAEAPLRTWYALVARAQWSCPADIIAMFNSADFVADNRVIFKIAGNRCWLFAHVSFEYQRVLVKLVGSHAEYENINPEAV